MSLWCRLTLLLWQTWLDGDFQDFELSLHDYNVYRKDRYNRRGGGVWVAVRCQLPCIYRTDLQVEVEMLALEIPPNPTTYVLFWTLYRAPNANETFVVNFKEFLVYWIFLWLQLPSPFNWNTQACCPTRSDVRIFVIFVKTISYSNWIWTAWLIIQLVGIYWIWF